MNDVEGVVSARALTHTHLDDRLSIDGPVVRRLSACLCKEDGVLQHDVVRRLPVRLACCCVAALLALLALAAGRDLGRLARHHLHVALHAVRVPLELGKVTSAHLAVLSLLDAHSFSRSNKKEKSRHQQQTQL